MTEPITKPTPEKPKTLGTEDLKKHLGGFLFALMDCDPKHHLEVKDEDGRNIRSFSFGGTGIGAVVVTDADDLVILCTLLSTDIDPDDSESLKDIAPKPKVQPIKVRRALPPPPSVILVDAATPLDKLPVKVKTGAGWLSGFLFANAEYPHPKNTIHIVATLAAGSLSDTKVLELVNAITERDCDKTQLALTLVGPGTFQWNTDSVGGGWAEVQALFLAGGAVECPSLTAGRSVKGSLTPPTSSLLSDFYFAWDPNPEEGGEDFLHGGLFGLIPKGPWDADHFWDDGGKKPKFPVNAPVVEEMGGQYSISSGTVLDARAWFLAQGATENIDILNWEFYKNGGKPKYDAVKINAQLAELQTHIDQTAERVAVTVLESASAAEGPLSDFYFARNLEEDLFGGKEDGDAVIIVRKTEWDATRLWQGPEPTMELNGLPLIPFLPYRWLCGPGYTWEQIRPLMEAAGAEYNTALRSRCY